LKTDQATVTQEKLKALPFVSPQVWKQVEAAGLTPVDFTLTVTPAPSDKTEVSYRIELYPTDAHVYIAAIDLHADQVAGQVVIADKQVELKGVHGRTLGGTMAAEAALDFRQPTDRLQFNVAVQRLDVNELPAAWRLPPVLKFDGRLSGHANLLVTVDHKVDVAGQGKGQITDATLLGTKLSKPILIELRAEGGRFQWQQLPLHDKDRPTPALPAQGDEEAPNAEEEETPPPAPGSQSLLGWAAQGLLAVPADLADAGAAAVAAVPRRWEWTKPQPAPAPAPRYVDARLSVSDINLEELVRNLQLELPITLAGKLSFDVTLLVPLDSATDLKTYKVHGTASMRGLNVAGLQLDTVESIIRYDQGALHVEDLRGRVAGESRPGRPATAGTVAGNASYQVVPAGDLSLRLQVKNVDLRALTRLTPSLPVRVEGPISGNFDGKIAGKTHTWDLGLDLTSPHLRLQNIPTERVHGSLGYHGDAAEYKLEGEALGGRFKLEGKLPPARPAGQPPGEARTAPPDGRLTIERVRLDRLMETLGLQGTLGSLRGSVSLDLPYRHEGPQRQPIGRGTFRIADVRWDAAELTSSIQGDVRLTPSELQVRDITAYLGEGLLRSQVSWNLKGLDRGWFNLSLDRVEASRLLTPFPTVAAWVKGPLDVSLRGTLGREWQGSGQLVLTRGRVLGVAVNEWRVPINFQYEPAQGSGRLDVSETLAQIAQGRAQGRASLRWGGASRLEGSLRFFNADWRGLFKEYENIGQAGSGLVTGRLDFGAEDLRSVNDLTASLDATLGRNQALELPVLQQLTPYLAPSSTTTFQQGDIRARLARGVIRVQRMTLISPLLQLILEGNVMLQGGRLDLEVVANTGSVLFSSTVLSQLGVVQLPTTALSSSFLTQASTLLSRRVIHLHIGGTIRSPSVRIEPIALLTEEAVRFFLTRAAIPVP
jgi:hypothetical protein